jgi:hypothetical protein
MKIDYSDKIASLFRKNKVVKLTSIMELVPNRSRCSIFRDLERLRYISSYNHAGCFYTLSGIPTFDKDGIWQYKGAFFSAHGSLKNTTKYLVDNSQNGKTHDELRNKLGIRVQNTLLDLVSMSAIIREKHMGTYVYISADDEARHKQMEKRRNDAIVKVSPYTTIEILRVVIKYPNYQASAIHSLLSKDGVNISLSQIESVFSLYDLGKKNSP